MPLEIHVVGAHGREPQLLVELIGGAHEQSAAGVGQGIVVGVAAHEGHGDQTLPRDEGLIGNGGERGRAIHEGARFEQLHAGPQPRP